MFLPLLFPLSSLTRTDSVAHADDSRLSIEKDNIAFAFSSSFRSFPFRCSAFIIPDRAIRYSCTTRNSIYSFTFTQIPPIATTVMHHVSERSLRCTRELTLHRLVLAHSVSRSCTKIRHCVRGRSRERTFSSETRFLDTTERNRRLRKHTSIRSDLLKTTSTFHHDFG